MYGYYTLLRFICLLKEECNAGIEFQRRLLHITKIYLFIESLQSKL